MRYQPGYRDRYVSTQRSGAFHSVGVQPGGVIRAHTDYAVGVYARSDSGPVTIAAGGMPHVVLILQPETEPALATATASIQTLSPRPSYQSRAPPQLL